VHRLRDTVLVTHNPIITKKNPYIDDGYYKERTDGRAIMYVTGKYKPIWQRQRGKCFYCGKNILKDQRKGIVAIDPARPNHTKNIAYVHECCSLGHAEFYESDEEIDTPFDLHELLMRMRENNPSQTGKKSKFFALAEHFRHRAESVFTLTFKEIESILEQPLCDSALKSKRYWHRRGDTNISFCWLSNGYAIRNINLAKACVVFERIEDVGGVVNIPPIILSGRVPHDAKMEIENMLEGVPRNIG